MLSLNMKYIKVLIPVVAVLVIAESVVLLSSISKRAKVTTDLSQTILTPGETPTVSVPGDEEVDFNVVFGTEQVQMQVGKLSKVEVSLLAKKTRSVDSLNLYVKYDPKVFNITNLTFDSRLPKPTFSKVSTAKGMIVVNYLISEAAGMKINEGDSLALIKFDATPKMVGDYSFEISNGNEANESATMFVENATVKALPYSGNKLTVNVTK